ncbi:MAG: 5-demethoxyubiquinol-8 5-hydroxylase UbiM [Cardiobacteriaceae bacterium]|nr:5-demethoxyubiquinol-8 5-hydroxylase UbiM [Cardiobacteriaceae bacterium]
MQTEFDIIIAGAGPAGLALARALSDTELKIAIVDPHSDEELKNPPFDGREIALTHPSKHILEQLDIWSGFRDEEIFILRDAKVINGESPYQLHFPEPSADSKKRPISNLGYLVSNDCIRREAYRATQEQKNIEWFLQNKVKTATSDAISAKVTLDDGTQLSAALLVAADSRLSSIRRQMGIVCDLHDFGRTVIVFRLEHEISNEQTAFECFFYGSTLALLPLTDKVTNCVITIDSRRQAEITEITGEELAALVESQVGGKYGKMRLASTIHPYPLVGSHAKSFYAPRCALVGDAACGMHPVTAHGYNLGLKSQEILSKLIIRQKSQGLDIGDSAMLAEYSRRHRINTIPMYYGTNTLVSIFTRETAAAKVLRSGILKIANNLPPVKYLISRQLTG